MPSSARASARGFTLVELLVVLGILAVLGAIAAPALVTQSPPERGARMLARLIEHARRTAALSGEVVFLRIDGDTVTVSREPPRHASASGREREGGASPTIEILPARALVEPRGLPFRVHPAGHGEGPSAHFVAGSEPGWTVSLDRWTGRAHVHAD